MLEPENEEESEAISWRNIRDTDGKQPAPIDINVINTTKITFPSLTWNNYYVKPRKMKLTNTGKTLILSAKWAGTRPYLNGGCLEGDYVFSQIHFHWGSKATEGSEHTIDELRLPLEMHIMHFKRCYLKQNEALRHPDGVVCIVCMFQLRSQHSSLIHPIVSSLKHIRLANSCYPINPFPLTDLIYPFEYDYYMYWGSIRDCIILWLIGREVTSLSYQQLKLFLQLMDSNLVPIYRNWREINCKYKRTIFHVNPSTFYTNVTLSPVPLRLKPSREILRKQLLENKT